MWVWVCLVCWFLYERESGRARDKARSCKSERATERVRESERGCERKKGETDVRKEGREEGEKKRGEKKVGG